MSVSIEQWSALSARVGGDLLQNSAKLEKMRQVDRSCGADVSWDTFCNKVEFAVSGGIKLDDIGWLNQASRKGEVNGK